MQRPGAPGAAWRLLTTCLTLSPRRGFWARASWSCVEPGNYPLVSPLVIDFPLVLRGSTEQVVDVDDPWPTGSVVPGTQTRVFAAAPMGARALVSVGRADSAVMSGVTIRGFVFEGGTTSFRFRLRAFRATSWPTTSSSADHVRLPVDRVIWRADREPFQWHPNRCDLHRRVSRVTLGHRCDQRHRMVNNNLGGIVLIGSSIFIPELGDQLDAVVRGNDHSNNAGTQGFGLRMFILRRDRVCLAIRNPRAISGARSRQPDGRQPSWIDARCRLSLPKLGWRL